VAESPTASPSGRERWLPRIILLGAGAALTLAFAPYNQWWLALLCPALLMVFWTRAATPREGALLGLAFGLGLYAAGTWWLFISINGFGQAPVWLALLIMGALVVIMAAWQALLGYVAVRWLSPRTPAGCLLLMPAAWLIIEWWRGWFLSGFPWLSLGYSQTDSWLAGLATVGGVYLVSLALLVGAGALVHFWSARGAVRWLAPVALIIPWTTGASMLHVEWTRESGPSRTVAILQGAIPQDLKWLVEKQQDILDIYERLHREAVGADLVVWPESALPDLANLYADYISAAWATARARNSSILMGVIRQDEDGDEVYYNSLLSLGLGKSDPAFYDKRHLVPFGEYFPVPDRVREWMKLMNLPYSDFTSGAARQKVFDLAGMRFAASICYEDAYPAVLNPEIRQSDVLVTVTNDGWFGHAAARYQHLQIARMLALQSRRFLIRAANDGVSGVVDPFGKVVHKAPEFTESVLRSAVTPRRGVTPYLKVGNWLAIGLAGLILGLAFLKGLRKAGGGTT
jgi:apolipoprotein N-acyltransferase